MHTQQKSAGRGGRCLYWGENVKGIKRDRWICSLLAPKNVSSSFFLMTSKHEKSDLSQTSSHTSINKQALPTSFQENLLPKTFTYFL